ncbi:MAG TPA: NAD(P)-dependent oxidoreductase [Vicinamibacterales bacterium]|nr:NAD(P)-dependent oxidoreductase [Vicinamibacterales bacterium]
MRVFVAGAGGAIGRRLIPRLVERGHEVVAATRTPEKLRQLRALGAEAVVMDGLDAGSVGEAVARAEPEVIAHQMTALAGVTDLKHFDAAFATTNELRTRGTEHLLAAADAVGVRRIVVQGYTGWPYAREGVTVVTEDDPFDPNPPMTMRRTLEALRRQEQLLAGASLEAVVLRYGSFYGPGASDGLVALVRKRKLPLVGAAPGVWSWIHIDDAAAATVAAVEAGITGAFNIVDDEPAPVSEWLPYLAEVLGAKPPRRVPVWLARLVAGEAVVHMTTRIPGASNAKAGRELGWRPRWASWRQGFRDGLEDRRRPALGANRPARGSAA